MKNHLSRSETKISLRFLKLFFPSSLAAWCSSVQQDIAKCVLQPLVQKEVLNLLHTYVVVLTLGTYNPCIKRFFLHVSLCLSIAQAIALKFGIQNRHNKKVPFAYTILFAERLHFSLHHEIFLISVTGFKKVGII